MNIIVDRLLYKLGYTYRYGSYRKIHNPVGSGVYAGKPLIKAAEGNELIAQKISEGKPFMAARIGSTELSALYNYYLNGIENIRWTEHDLSYLNTHSGFFPNTPKNVERFCEEMFAHLHQADVMGVWYNEGEEQICARYAPDAQYVELVALEPYYFPNPWSRMLKGKKVLVIHPFQDSIEYQMQHNKEKLFPGSDILPEFELKTIKAVQALAHEKTEFASWFDAYRSMCDKMLKTDFDIAIIGAGAYGLPLASFAKSIGKQAVHMGGATQLLFGIIGSRWLDREDVNKFFNQYWKRPYPHEAPAKAEMVENACYW